MNPNSSRRRGKVALQHFSRSFFSRLIRECAPAKCVHCVCATFKGIGRGNRSQEVKSIMPKSKTAAGTGRLIPLSRRVCASLSLWVGYFPNVTPESYLFPLFPAGVGG